jgi:hypothetical protein
MRQVNAEKKGRKDAGRCAMGAASFTSQQMGIQAWHRHNPTEYWTFSNLLPPQIDGIEAEYLGAGMDYRSRNFRYLPMIVDLWTRRIKYKRNP